MPPRFAAPASTSIPFGASTRRSVPNGDVLLAHELFRSHSSRSRREGATAFRRRANRLRRESRQPGPEGVVGDHADEDGLTGMDLDVAAA